ncbi:MAG: GGDEF and EAL domain-containing protein [Alphaproteobacteria bacterium]|nr:GGDEF and EAL domain-containing protein [Alphaproteobacteria bacterium]
MGSSTAYRASARLADLSDLETLRLAVASADQVAYDWLVETDAWRWTGASGQVLETLGIAGMTCGEDLVRKLDPATHRARAEAIERAPSGEPFRIEYRLAGDEEIWVEECGACLRDADGRLQRIVGSMKIISERKRREDALAYRATYDDLTGNFNRVSLKERLARAVDRAEAEGTQSVFLLAAIDDLAVINETFGIDIADEVIVGTGRLLETVAGADSVVGRTSGNKFGILLEGCPASEMETRARRMIALVREATFETRGGRVAATISVGGVALPHGAETANAALARTEEALSHAKGGGRSAFRAFLPEPNRESRRKRNLLIGDQIIAALAEGRMKLAFQPIVAADTGAVVQYECLARLIGRDGEAMAAGEFIAVAEQMGLVRLIDARALELALRTLMDRPAVKLSLNVSGITASDPSWLEKLVAGLANRRDVASRLTVELTETQAIHDIEESGRFVAAVKALGCHVAIDDFGAGYTSFRNLKSLDVDMVKIDGSFVRGIAECKENRLFVRTLVDLARNLGLDCVAEWVSSEEERAILRAIGVQYLQGFAVGKPTIEPAWLVSEPA